MIQSLLFFYWCCSFQLGLVCSVTVCIFVNGGPEQIIKIDRHLVFHSYNFYPQKLRFLYYCVRFLGIGLAAGVFFLYGAVRTRALWSASPVNIYLPTKNSTGTSYTYSLTADTLGSCSMLTWSVHVWVSHFLET